MASFRAVRRALCTAAEASPSPAPGAAPGPAPGPAPGGRWERLKQSKAGVWIRSMFSDYREACREVAVGARERPLKATVYVSLLGGAYACFYTKPDQPSFYATLLDRSNQLALLSPWIRNAASDRHVQNLMQQWNQGRLRHLGLGLCSLVYSTDFDPQSALYEASCSNLALRWRELPHRVLDVGFAGRWWLLERNMDNYDVNEDEFKHLPSHMQATSPPSVQDVERSEQQHKDSWLPIALLEEEEETQVQASSQQDLSPEPSDTQLTVTLETPQESNRDTTTDETGATGWTLDVQEEAEEDLHVQREAEEDLHVQREAEEDLQVQREAEEDLQVEQEAIEDLHVQEEAIEDLHVQEEAIEDLHVAEMQNDTVVVETVENSKEKEEEEGVEQIEAQSLRN